MLTFNKVSFDYNGIPILKDITLHVKEGELVFLIGKSGCGKSTLLELIYLNNIAKSGEISFLNCNYPIIDSGKLSRSRTDNIILEVRRKLGIVFQDYRLLSDRNIYDNLAFILQVTGVRKREIKRKINNVLADIGLNHRRKSYPNELSGGEQQRVSIARSIINDPSLILADEPTGNLDPETSNEILDLLKRINSRGTGVLITTHNYDLISRFKARVLKLENGTIKEL